MKKELNAQNLKELLWETVTDLRSRKIDVKSANAVSVNARAIMSVVKAEIQIHQFVDKAKGKTKATALLSFSG